MPTDRKPFLHTDCISSEKAKIRNRPNGTSWINRRRTESKIHLKYPVLTWYRCLTSSTQHSIQNDYSQHGITPETLTVGQKVIAENPISLMEARITKGEVLSISFEKLYLKHPCDEKAEELINA